MRHSCWLIVAPFLAMHAVSAEEAVPAGERLQEVVVTATLREQALVEVPASVTVLDTATVQAAGQQHFQDVLDLVPNLNWAGGTSRPRYFQIRGIGEREQYEGAPNPSVGFLIDDIDFSGIGMAATLFDVSQVEVLRGPQGTRYGTNALAGLIAITTAAPSSSPLLQVNADVGSYDTRSAGLVASAPVEQLSSAWRLAVQEYRSNGFRRDVYLGRDDTNDRNELTARFKWRWQPSEDTRVDVTLLRADLNNGYDAWSIDNSWISQSDRPGKDTQLANAAAVRLESTAWKPATLTVIASVADSNSVNSYDGDWGNPILWAPFTYDYFFKSATDRRTYSLETRLTSPAPQKSGDVSWLIGVYGLRLRENIHELSVGIYTDPDPVNGFTSTTDEALASNYVATNAAVFGQLDGKLGSAWRWSLGARAEQRDEKYHDQGFWQGDDRLTDDSERDRLFGGQATMSYDIGPHASTYVSVSRGYKAGGFNLGSARTTKPSFKPEYLWNFEMGIKGTALDERVYAETTVFYEKRRDVQIRTGVQLDPVGDPNSYLFFTSNASAGYNYGLESALRVRATRRLEIGASLGLLRTQYQNFVFGNTTLADRDQPHAPHYQFAVDATWRAAHGWFARVDFIGKDRFYFDVPGQPDTSSFNDTRSHPYTLTNVRLGYEKERWSASVWGRNVFDKEYAVRGFYFGNEPPDFPNKLYTQRGDPRQWGVSAKYNFL